MKDMELNQRLTSRAARIAGMIPVIIATYWLIMWFTGLAVRESTTTIIPKANMALCQLLAGIALLLLGQRTPMGTRRRLGLALALVVVLVSALTMKGRLTSKRNAAARLKIVK